MAEILLFGGTSEGRELSALLKTKGISTLVCTATEYGESLLEAGGSVAVRRGRLDQEAMAALMEGLSPRLVIDATHPYADLVSRNLRAACRDAQQAYVRVRRAPSPEKGFLTFSSLEALIHWLETAPGVIFSSLGAKEAGALRAVNGFDQRIWLRILPFAEGLEECIRAGFPRQHIICMQGPFSQDLNAAMFRATGAKILLTKESGAAGGFSEKLAAARACGMMVAVLARPEDEGGLVLEEIKERIERGAL